MSNQRRGWSTTDSERKVWEPVTVPTPVFESREEMERWEAAAAANPRQPGEDRVAWAERVTAAAQGRAPGEEG